MQITTAEGLHTIAVLLCVHEHPASLYISKTKRCILLAFFAAVKTGGM